MMTTYHGTRSLLTIAAGLAASAMLLAISPATAQEISRTPIIRFAEGIPCLPTSPGVKMCIFDFETVAENRRWEITDVSCGGSVPGSTTQISVGLDVVNPNNNNVLGRYFFVPVRLTNSIYAFNDTAFIPINQNRFARMRILVLSPAFPAANATTSCTISAYNVVLQP